MSLTTGIGTVWARQGLEVFCTYQGFQANHEYQILSGCNTSVPLENDGGPGTACTHWEIDCFRTELMTGDIATGLTHPLSRTTVATLDDLGYIVDYDAADPFGIEKLGTSCVCNRHLGELHSPLSPQRRLSAEAREAAITYGKSLLAANKPPNDVVQLDGVNQNDNLGYIGNEVVAVIWKEGDHFYDVIVTAND
jgi:Leishmanolysin